MLVLVARGLSNKEIASASFLTEAIVKTHLTHILTKLNLRDRVQAVVLAYEWVSSSLARLPPRAAWDPQSERRGRRDLI